MNHESFYATAAQVIPVFWVILVFQLRLFGREPKKGYFSLEADESHRSKPTVLLIIVVAIGFLLWTGEGFALDALFRENDSGFSRAWVRSALFFGGLYVFMMPLQPWAEALLERTPLERLRQALWKRERKDEGNDDPS